MTPITVRYAFRPPRRSLATEQVSALFGLDAEEPPHTVADHVALDIRPGDVVLFTGPSGSGKSSLLRAAGAQLAAIDANALALSNAPLIDALPGTLASRLELLSACGLSEARLLLRTPAELSDGQRYRFRIASAAALAERPNPLFENGAPRFIMADEFAAQLDRTLAQVLAFNLRKLASRTGVGFLLVTTHDDLFVDLNPDLHVRCLGDGAIEAVRRDVQKKTSHSQTNFGCRKVPSPTGRISLGGIIAAITSRSSAAS